MMKKQVANTKIPEGYEATASYPSGELPRKRRFRGAKLITLAAALCALLCLTPVLGLAADGSIEISDAEGLAALAGQSEDYQLTADIDLSKNGDWTPIAGFTGTLDGNGHIISGLNVTTAPNGSAGLFATLSNTQKTVAIRNLVVQGQITVTSADSLYAGGIVGFLASNGVIENCAFIGEVSASSFMAPGKAGKVYSGGIAGNSADPEEPKINNCYAAGKVTAQVDNSGGNLAYAGGITGWAGGDMGAGSTVSHCLALKGSDNIQAGYSGNTLTAAEDLVVSVGYSDNPTSYTAAALVGVQAQAQMDDHYITDPAAFTTETLESGLLVSLNANKGDNLEWEIDSQKNNGYPVLKQPAAPSDHNHPVCGASCTDREDHQDQAWQEWTSTTALPDKAGYYYLAADVTINKTWEPQDGTYLCLNGHDITPAAGKRPIKLGSAQTNLTLTDCNTDRTRYGYWQGEADQTYVIADTSDGAPDGADIYPLQGGIIRGGKCDGSSGGALYIDSEGGSFTMYGGNIAGNSAMYGGGIDLACGSFTMYGGNITGNNATDSGYGGGIYAYNGNVTLERGNITNNNAQGYGGGIYNNEAKLTIQDASISGNRAAQTGGGIYNNNILQVSGTPYITGNQDKNGACNLYLVKDKVISFDSPLNPAATIGVTCDPAGFKAANAVTFTSGWATAGDRLKCVTSDNSTYQIIESGAPKELAMTASNGPFSLTYDDNVEDDSVSNMPPADTKEYKREEVVALNTTIPVRPGYTFLGWCTEPTCADGKTLSEVTFAGKNITVYAIWQEKLASITNAGKTTYFADLPSAFDAAADGDTIRLEKNFVSEEEVEVKAGEKALTLDLNGKAIMLSDGYYLQYLTLSSGSLTITGNGTLDCVLYQSGGFLTIENGTFIAFQVETENAGNSTLKSGTFVGANYGSLGVSIFISGEQTAAKAKLQAMLPAGKAFSQPILYDIENELTYLPYPLSIIDAETPSLTGTVQDSAQTPLAGAKVTLKRGNETVTATTTDSQGSYTLRAPAGLYNIVATAAGKTMTLLVEVTQDAQLAPITMPAKNVSSKLNVSADTPDVVVGGLEQAAAELAAANPSESAVAVNMTVTGKTAETAENASEIKAKAGSKTLEYLEIALTQTLSGNTLALPEASSLLQIIVPFDKTKKRNITVYRYHDGAVDALTTTANADGEKIEVKDNSIIIHAKKFSTYAIGYTISSGSSGGGGRGSIGTSYATYPPTIVEMEHGTVTVSPKNPAKDDKVTITPAPAKGYELDSITVTDANGKTITATANSNGTYRFTQPQGEVTIKATFKAAPAEQPQGLPFTDVAEGSWYYNSISYVYENNLMKGETATAFRPNLNTSRGMIATILWRLENSPEAATANFTDVKTGAYYADAVAWATANGIMKGYDNSKFGPNDPITREQLAATLYRYQQYKGTANPVDASVLKGFTDAGKVSSYAIDGLAWAVDNNIISGQDSGLLAPQGKAVRAEAATMLTRLLKK